MKRPPPSLPSMENNFVAGISMEVDMKRNSTFGGRKNKTKEKNRLRAHDCDLLWIFNMNILIA